MNRDHRETAARGGLAALLACALVAASVAPAHAAPSALPDAAVSAHDGATSTAEAAVSAVDAATTPPTAGTLGDAATVDLPSTSREPLTITAEDAPTLSIRLPAGDGAVAGSTEHPGVRVYDNGDGSTTVPVVAGSTVRIHTVLRDRTAPEEYPYAVSIGTGSSLSLTDDGGAVVLDPAGQPHYRFAPPWAVDATGAAVPTSYSVSGTTLLQHVDLSSAGIVFPVVADPQPVLWPGGTGVRFDRAETRAIADSGDASSAAATLCGLIGSAPGAVACGLGAALVLRTKIQPFKDAASNGRCSQINIPYGTGPALWFTYEVDC
ncbi:MULTISPECIES: hypothetical protein [unclassified Rathayibacter]|uniref:hypothetical protein n=1 Tax=unclassified Rathayibacter TaxID=2609250 RepID=UPI000CE77BD9|nr:MULTISPECIES: hypothetical protein [unclassified Rathayibacter]PPG48625.1 hypothetical protein C5C24_15455 [Rathayibacter sp. AY2B3]PPI20543.1 hypothetical protein C5D08_11060 [Rathayibacter sp. AY1B6]PPI24070.1 hypothetical protein C5D44_12235 [Rathayibacter sp. AY1B5]PPI35274.1 hypothetical protein C5D34_07355 [Rathayibacter sp. AY1B1]